MKIIVTFAPQVWANAENEIDAAPEPREFDSREKAADYLNQYWFDEWQEAQGDEAAPSQPALYRAFAQTYEGFAQGGNFKVKFWGDTAEVEVQYDSLGELLTEFALAELACIAATDDEEGPNDADVEQIVAELAQALPMFGAQNSPWCMHIANPDPGPDPTEYVASMTAITVPYYVNGKYVQMPCMLGRVTFWPL